MTGYAGTRRGDRVALDRAGRGPGVVFIAGAGPDRATDPITSETAALLVGQGATTVVYDRLGRGESTVDGPVDLERELEAVAAAILVAGGTAVLVGHSSGCAIALAAAARRLPVTGLVLWEAPIAGDPVEVAEWVEGFERLLDDGELEQAQLHYMRDMPPEWLEGARSSPVWPALVAHAPSLRADAQALRWAVADPPPWTGVDVPVLTVVGEETLPEMAEASRLLVERLPSAVAERLPGADHVWEPKPMAERLARFVRDRARAGAAGALSA